MKALEAISHWEKLKKLIERENIYADEEIEIIDSYIKECCKKELNG